MKEDRIRSLLARVRWIRAWPDKKRRWLDEIRLWAAQRDDCLWLDRVETYRPCRVAGVVTCLRIDPRAGVIQATISDGQASLGAEWPIEPPVKQLRVAPGVGLILEGLARLDRDGQLLMVEPAFEIVPGPSQR
jgi:hypothetical protein